MGFLAALSDPDNYSARLFAQSGQVAFDVGANAGHVTKKLAENFASVVAFEPAEESFGVLSLQTQHLRNVEIVNAAVSDHSGFVTLREAQVTEKWGELVTGESMPDWGATTGSREVPSVTLDDCLLVYGRPDLVKIDTEGHEWAVLCGASETLHEATPWWWIEIHDVEQGNQIDALFQGLHYELEVIHHPSYAPGSVEDARHYYLIARPW